MVTVGERVYVTLGIDGPLTALDAATGKDMVQQHVVKTVILERQAFTATGQPAGAAGITDCDRNAQGRRPASGFRHRQFRMAQQQDSSTWLCTVQRRQQGAAQSLQTGVIGLSGCRFCGHQQCFGLIRCCQE